MYFDAGVPQDPGAAAAGTLSPRFTNPRGPGSDPGLGLDDHQVADLTAFVQDALYDPAFVRFDPDSSTRTFELREPDTTYSVFRPDLAALGAVDGRPASGLPSSNNDALSRRDMGLEFLDVPAQAGIELIDSDANRGHRRQKDQQRITNNTSSIVDTHLLIVVQGLSDQVRMVKASGTTSTGDPYLRVFLPNGALLPGENIVETLVFARRFRTEPVGYTLGSSRARETHEMRPLVRRVLSAVGESGVAIAARRPVAHRSGAYPSHTSELPLLCDPRGHSRRLAECRCRRERALALGHRRDETPGCEFEDGLDLVAPYGELLHHLVDGHAVFQVLENDGDWGARTFEHPRAAHLAGDTLHDGALGPIERCHGLISFQVPAYGISARPSRAVTAPQRESSRPRRSDRGIVPLGRSYDGPLQATPSSSLSATM